MDRQTLTDTYSVFSLIMHAGSVDGEDRIGKEDRQKTEKQKNSTEEQTETRLSKQRRQ